MVKSYYSSCLLIVLGVLLDLVNSQDSVVYLGSFNTTTELNQVATSSESHAWIQARLLHGGQDALYLIREMPSADGHSVYHSRRISPQGTVLSQVDLRFEPRIVVHSMSSLPDGSLALLTQDRNNGIDLLRVQIYGPGEQYYWRRGDFITKDQVAATLGNIVLKPYNSTSYGVLFNSIAAEGVEPYVYFQIFNKVAQVHWNQGLPMLSPNDTSYVFSALSFAPFSNGSVIAVYDGQSTADSSMHTVFARIINGEGEYMTSSMSIHQYNASISTDVVKDVVVIADEWVASVLVTDLTTNTAQYKLLRSRNLELTNFTDITGLKEIDELFANSFFNQSLVLIYKVSFDGNSTTMWKSSIFELDGTVKEGNEKILAVDAQVLNSIVAADKGLYLTLSETIDSETSIKLGSVYDKVEKYGSVLIAHVSLIGLALLFALYM